MAWASEAHLEAWALAELQALGFAYAPAAAVSPEAASPERAAYHDAILATRLDRRHRPAKPGPARRARSATRR